MEICFSFDDKSALWTFIPLIKSIPNDKILDWSEFKAFADDKIDANEKISILFGKGGKHCEKRRKCWLPAFSPFPTMFSKNLFSLVIKGRDCVVKG